MFKSLLAALRLAGTVAVIVASGALSAADALFPREVKIGTTEFVFVPAGWFHKIGGVAQFNGKNADGVKVWLDDYYIAKYEARARDLERYLNEMGERPTAPFVSNEENCSLQKNPGGTYSLVKADEDLPATHMSWMLADELSRWMGFRLPTEAEWEKAARGGDSRIYPWGSDPPDDTLANFGATSKCLVWPVDRFSKGQSPYGAYNMAGNVREYVADWWNPEVDAAQRDGMKNPPPAVAPINPPEGRAQKLLKGGRWASTPAQMQIDARVPYYPEYAFQCNGTRYAVDAEHVLKFLSVGKATALVH